MGGEARLPKSRPTATFASFKVALLGRVAEKNRNYQEQQSHTGLTENHNDPTTNPKTASELVDHINRTRNTFDDPTTEHRSIGEKVLDILKPKHKHSHDPSIMARTRRISLSPTRQASFYAKFELILATTVSNFLMAHADLLDRSHLNREIRTGEGGFWSLFDGPAEKRVRPDNFMFPLAIQHSLLQKNCAAFVKHGAFSNHNVLAVRQAAKVITGWGRIVDGLAHKTFCEPDWLLIEHLQGGEKLIQLIGNHYLSEEVANYTSWKLQIVVEITNETEKKLEDESAPA